MGKEGVVLGGGTGGLPSLFGISIFYVIIPWIGVMMAGFGFGQLFLKPAAVLRKHCLRIGLAATGLFLLVGSVVVLSGSNDETPFIFKLLGQQKYPPSQLFLLMTLGPVIALVPWAQQVKGKVADAIKIIGRVPMFYYLLHLLLIHLSAYVVNMFLFGNIHQEWYETAPFVGMDESVRWGLPLLYLVWAIDVVILYYACSWYARYKATHPKVGWVKYV